MVICVLQTLKQTGTLGTAENPKYDSLYPFSAIQNFVLNNQILL